MAIPLKGLKLKRLYLPPAKRPDKRAEAAYLAAWYQIEQQGLRRPRNPNAVAQVVDFSRSKREQKKVSVTALTCSKKCLEKLQGAGND